MLAHRVGGRTLSHFPAGLKAQAELEPVYEELDGWTEDLTGARTTEDLPKAARAYLERVAELVDVPIGVVSVGPGREQSLPLSA